MKPEISLRGKKKKKKEDRQEKKTERRREMSQKGQEESLVRDRTRTSQ